MEVGSEKMPEKERVAQVIKELEELSRSVLELKQSSIPRRPIVIEFCGSPKSGKSSCINSLDLFLRRNNFRTKVLTERASVCPVNNKFDPYFNIWTASTAIAELSMILANNSKDYDLVIMDRGIFDGICWFTWLREEKHLDQSNYLSLIQYLTMKRWREVIDLIYVFTASPEVSIDREYANLLTRKTGSIMRPKVLKSYKKVVESASQEYRHQFRKIECVDTSKIGINEVNYQVTKNILKILEDATVEKIAYFDKNGFETIEEHTFMYSSIPDEFRNNLQYEARTDVELDKTKIQPIPILIITNSERNKLIVAKKGQTRTGKKSPEANKILLYFGGHVRYEDSLAEDQQKDTIRVLQTALSREIKEELGIDVVPADDDPFCIWIQNTERSEKHLAICFVYEEDLEHLKFKLDKNEFITEKGSKSGKIVPVADILKDYDELEDWSKYILQHFFAKYSPTEQQQPLKL